MIVTLNGMRIYIQFDQPDQSISYKWCVAAINSMPNENEAFDALSANPLMFQKRRLK